MMYVEPSNLSEKKMLSQNCYEEIKKPFTVKRANIFQDVYKIYSKSHKKADYINGYIFKQYQSSQGHHI